MKRGILLGLIVSLGVMFSACSKNTCPVAHDGRNDPPDYKKDDSYEEKDSYPY